MTQRIFSVLAVSTLLCCRVNAQTPELRAILDSPVELQLEKATLADTLKALQTKSHLNVVADSLPMKDTADVKFKGTVKEALEKIGQTYDYGWTATQVNIVVMGKRFTSPFDRPQVNMDEMRKMAADQLRVLRLLKYDKDVNAWGTTIKSLAHTFTPEQMQKLTKGERLTSSEISPAQMELVRQAIVTRILAGPATAFERLLAQMTTMKTSKLHVAELPAGKDPSMRRMGVEHLGGPNSSLFTILGEVKIPQKEAGK